MSGLRSGLMVAPPGGAAGVAVVGAGIVGVATALALAMAGRRVTLIDRGEPGRMTSFGNTGVLVENPWATLASPALLGRLPGLVFGRSPALRIDPGFALRRAGLLARLLATAAAARPAAGIRAVHGLLRHSQSVHREWIAAAGASGLLRETGWLKAFRDDRAARAFRPEAELLERSGTRHRRLSADELGELEPALAGRFSGGVLLEDACSLSDPLALTLRYLEMFRGLGGRLETADVRHLEPGSDGWTLHVADGSLRAEQVVLATGPWGPELPARLGWRLPMVWERGYHRHLAPGPGQALGRPVHDVAGGFVMTPQSRGVRVTSGVEIADRDAPPRPAQIDRAVREARRAAGLGEPVDAEPWLGSRPTLIDGLPAIGRAPGLPGLWLNLGHHHVGLSLSAGAGRLVAALMAGLTPPVDPAPFDPRRLPGG